MSAEERGDSLTVPVPVDREWPGVATAAWQGRHGDDPHDEGWFICEGCGSQHAPNYRGCNAFREPTIERCAESLGEVFRCARPLGHLGKHEVLDFGLRVSWEPENDSRQGPSE